MISRRLRYLLVSEPTGLSADDLGKRVGMREMLKSLLALAGAAIVIASAMISGYRLHCMVERCAPGLSRIVPRDGGVIAGIVVGACAVALWVT